MQDKDNAGRKRESLAERIAGRVSLATPLSQSEVPIPERRAPAAPIAVTTVQPPPSVPVAPAETVSATESSPAVAETAAPEAASTRPPPPVLRLNFNRLQASGVITPNAPRSSNTEEFRVIKRQVLNTTFTEERVRRSDRSNVIMVTSSIPGEGKTFMSLNLAMSFSMERDLYVLLVDSDNYRHSLSTQLGADRDNVGLVDMMLDPTLQVRDIMRRTDLPNLSFIPAGKPHPQGAELMSSKGMVKLMGELAQRYPDRMIIIDTPPLLASTEGVVLSSHVGHAIVVVEKDRTTKRQLHRTLEMLEGCENISCILNMDSAQQTFSEYAYGY